MLRFRLQARSAQKLLRRISRRARGMGPVYKHLETMLMDAVRDNFYSQGRPRWKKRKKRYPWPILRKTGRLFDSIYTQVVGSSVVARSDLPYAATHQYGRGPIPARPYLDATPSEQQEMADVVARYLAGESQWR